MMGIPSVANVGISQGMPATCTTMIARVFGVSFLKMSPTSMFTLLASMSANTGVAPASLIAVFVAIIVNGVVITSPPSTPAKRKAKVSADVPLFNSKRFSTHKYFFRASVSSTTFGPSPTIPDPNTPATNPYAIGSILTLNIGII